jgi:lipid-A-disaccharide synthase
MAKRMVKYFFVAGETSGDVHGGKLISAIKRIHPNILFLGHGGENMKNSGMEIIEHTDTLGIMGFIEVIKHLPKMIQILNETVDIITHTKPDRIILIDYPGFNLRLAKHIHHLNIPITYFILPQAWAWKEKRVETMKATLDQSLSIFPFEQEWYQSKGLSTKYIGHPFVETININESTEEYFTRHDLNADYPILLLLPGSRRQEIKLHWPVFLITTDLLQNKIENLQVVVVPAPGINLNDIPANFKIEPNARKAITNATAAIVSSGTATLECAMEDTPIVVCYKFNFLSWIIIKFITNVRHASIVNLIANESIVEEYLQNKMTPKNLATAIQPLLDKSNEIRKIMLAKFDTVRRTLGMPGVYDRAAEAIVSRKNQNLKI